MIHQVIFWNTARPLRTTPRNSSAGSPTASAAAPSTMPSTTSWSTLKDSPLESDSSPRMLAGTIELRKSRQEPVRLGASAPAVPMVALAPGLVSRPMVIPMVTAIRAVTANQTRVWTASLAALVTCRRLAMLTMMAVSTSGTTTTWSSDTKVLPTVLRVAASQSSEKVRARNPSSRPRPRPSRTCAQKGKVRRRVGASRETEAEDTRGLSVRVEVTGQGVPDVNPRSPDGTGRSLACPSSSQPRDRATTSCRRLFRLPAPDLSSCSGRAPAGRPAPGPAGRAWRTGC